MTDVAYQPGDLVESRSGRDAGRLLFVISVQDDFLTLCDGRMRRTEHPKQKKAKHVRYAGRVLENSSDVRKDCVTRTVEKLRAGEPVTNSELRRALNAFIEGGSGNGLNVRRDANVKG